MITTTHRPATKAAALHAIREADAALNRETVFKLNEPTMTAQELLDTGLFCGQPGPRQLVPMLFEITAMQKQVAENRASWDDAYGDPRAVDAVLKDFDTVRRGLNSLIRASADC